MKTLLLKVFLVSCVLFLGIKSAHAGNIALTTITTTASSNGLAAATLNSTQTAAVLGVKAVGSVSSTTITKFTFSSIATISTYFTAFRLYYSTTSNTYVAGTTAVVPTSSVTIAGTTITATPTAGQVIASGATVYYFLVGDFVPTNSSATCTFSVSSLTGPTTTTGSASGPGYTFAQPVTLGSGATGLATSPASVAQTGMGIFGFSVAVTGTQTITQLNLTASASAPLYFTNYKLYSGTSNSFGSASIVTGANVSVSGTTVTANTFSKSVTNSTLYFFIVADYTPPANVSTYQLTANSVVATATYTNGGPISGTNYTVGPITYTWVGNTATAGVYLWSTAANWSPASVPGPNDNAQIGITTFTNNPTISTTASVGSITFGSNNSNNITLTTNSTLTVARDITVQADLNSTGTEIVYLAGTGTVNAVNANILSNIDQWDDDDIAFSNYTETINSSVTNLNLSGNVALTSTFTDYNFFGVVQNFYSANFQVSGGTTTVAGTISTTNVNRSGDPNMATSYVTVSGGVLALSNATALSGLSTSGNNGIGFSAGTVNYTGTGATQTVYTSSAANVYTTSSDPNPYSPLNVYSSISYYNLTISGTAAETTATGTLTVSNNFTNSANTTLATNSTITNVTGQLIPTSGTLTCGSGTLTAGSMLFSGGNLTAGSGTVTCNGNYVNNGGSFNCGTAASASVYFKNAYTNNSGTFTANPTSTSSVYFTGTNQTLQDNTTAGTTLNNVTFSGNNTAISVSTGATGTGNFAIANTGTLTIGANAKLTAGSGSAGGAGYLTLISTASSTASIAQIPTTSSIVGAVNVQRSITGGTGTRGYRLLSSPVNINTNSGGAGNLSLAYLNTNASFGGTTYPGALTMGPGTGFTINGSTNPIIYLYDETRTTNNVGFTTGKNIGIYSIGSTTVTTLTGTTQAGTAIPVGNSYLLYYVGNNTSTVVANTRVPDNTIITATGYINQGGTTGNVPVKFWKLGTTPIPYDINGATLPGLNQVGNPFPCTISLNQVSADNTAISKVFWELIPGGNYVSYSAATGHPVSDVRASNYIVSGQGFLIQAQGTGETLTFKEGEKVSPYPTGLATPFNTATSTALLMSLPTKPGLNTDITAQSISTSPIVASEMAPPATTDSAMQAYLATRPSPSLIGLHLQITKDSLHYVQTGIYFNNAINNDNYSQNNDAVNINGSDAQVFLSSYSADNVSLGINQLSNYTKGKRIKLYTAAITTGLYNISLADIANIDTGIYNIYLVDKKMNDSLDMVRYRSYAFNINNSDTTTYGANRFVLAIERKTLPPYQLIKFAGQKVTTGVQLTWQTLNEGDHTGFVLQKLTNTNSYNAIYTLQSNSDGNYSYIDKHPLTGNNTYKLQQTDINGKVTYSSPVTINYDSRSPNGNMTVYPNPSKSIITVSLALNTTASDYIADIYNTSGTVISHQVVKADTWTQDISSYKLGVYIIEVKTNSGDLVGKSKFVKIN